MTAGSLHPHPGTPPELRRTGRDNLAARIEEGVIDRLLFLQLKREVKRHALALLADHRLPAMRKHAEHRCLRRSRMHLPCPPVPFDVQRCHVCLWASRQGYAAGLKMKGKRATEIAENSIQLFYCLQT